MKRTALFTLACATLTAMNGVADLGTCKSYLKARPGPDGKIVSGLLGQEPRETEEVMAWLDRYCADNPKDLLVSAMRKFLAEKQR